MESDKLDWSEDLAQEEGATDDSANEEENADMSVLDYDYSSIQEKIAAGLKEKEKGNKLFAKGKYEQAWKQYDKCFVHVYTSKEEWAAIGKAGRKEINHFKLPCHLNRGLCRLRTDDVANALWDFSEALRIDGSNVKGLYRKGVTLMRMVQIDLKKEGTDELWDLDLAEGRASEAKQILMDACKMVPNDVAVRKTLTELKAVKEQLVEHRKKYRQDQKKLYSHFISNLDKDNQVQSDEKQNSMYDDMPPLERIRIE